MKTQERWAPALVFRHFTSDERDFLARAGIHRTVERGEIIARGGEPWPFTMFVESGQIQAVMTSPEGRFLVPTTLQPETIFWGRPLYDQEPMPATLEAVTTAQVVIWSHRDLLPLIQRNNPAMWDMCRSMARLLEVVASYMKDFAFNPLTGRLARLVLEKFDQTEGRPQVRSLSLDRMAAHLGTTREVVCRLLRNMTDSGILHLTRSRLVIMDLERLRRLAGNCDGQP